jgi:hypothetical protein
LQYSNQFQFANTLSALFGRVMLNPFTPFVQKKLLEEVGEEKMYDYFTVIPELRAAYEDCETMLQSDKGWAIRNPLILLKYFRNRKFVNNFNFEEVVCCSACFVFLPKKDQNFHKCSSGLLEFMHLKGQRFGSYLKKQVNMLTDPQMAVWEIFRPLLNQNDSRYSCFNRFGRNVILYGPPGTGKSFICKLIVWAHYRVFGWDSILVGAIVKAQSQELVDGETINSITGVNIVDDETIATIIAPLNPLTEKENIQKVKEFLSKCPIMSDAKKKTLALAK